MKLSSFFEGLGATPNFKFFALLAAFAGWLFVVYWVRQYELATNPRSRPITSPPVITASSDDQPDRIFVNRLRLAYPAPGPERGNGFWQQATAQSIEPGPGQALSASASGSERFGQPAEAIPQQVNVTNASSCSAAEPIMPSEPIPTQLPILSRSSGQQFQPSFQTSVQMPVQTTGQRANNLYYPPAYNVQINSTSGPRLQTIANR
jgi:hypothetical protein